MRNTTVEYGTMPWRTIIDLANAAAESNGRFFSKTNWIDSPKTNRRIDSNRELECSNSNIFGISPTSCLSLQHCVPVSDVFCFYFRPFLWLHRLKQCPIWPVFMPSLPFCCYQTLLVATVPSVEVWWMILSSSPFYFYQTLLTGDFFWLSHTQKVPRVSNVDVWSVFLLCADVSSLF